MSRAWSLVVYKALTRVAEPMAPSLLRRRAGRGKEDIARLPERLGVASAPRPPGPLVWMHGASVGETLSLLPFVHRLERDRPDLTILITSGTRTSADLLRKRLPPRVIHQYLPVDGPAAVRRFLDHWRPQLGVIAESELWPNLILQARRAGVRMALVSARITEGSAKGWTRARASARRILAAFDVILPQDAQNAGRIQALGGATGPMLNLKFAGEALPYDEAELRGLKAQIGPRQVVLAASTHPGEEDVVLGAFSALAHSEPAPLLVIAPRHPGRAEAILSTLEGITTARRSDADPIEADTQVYLADTLGEMGLWFRLADVAVMGGGFVAGVGGHNPLEPARLGVPVVTGPEVFNFAPIYARMLADEAVLVATSESDLSTKVQRLLADPAKAQAIGAKALAYAQRQAAECDAAFAAVEALLPAP